MGVVTIGGITFPKALNDMCIYIYMYIHIPEP